MIIDRKKTRKIYVGSVAVGGDAPVSIQSMTKTLTTDVAATIAQVRQLEDAGCDIVRVSIPDNESLEAFRQIRKHVEIPVVADIHFDYRLAIGSIEAGADAIRINPGNIGSNKRLAEVAKAAISASIPIRIGVNTGSVKRNVIEAFNGDHVAALVETARQYVEMVEDMGLKAIKVSLKSPDVIETIDAYRAFSAISDWPLHLGVTEAGTLFSGAIRSALGIGALLLEGIGDTIRVSLSADPVKEITSARVLLESIGLRDEGVRVVSCPTCARANADIETIATEVEDALSGIKRHMVVAVMGCIVNGPGEARDADIGVACDERGGVLFRHGKPVKRVSRDEIVKTILEEVDKESRT